MVAKAFEVLEEVSVHESVTVVGNLMSGRGVLARRRWQREADVKFCRSESACGGRAMTPHLNAR